MNTRTLIRYLFGHAGAIQEVARNKSALWWGLALVLITSIPRNYDQTFILEKPFLWVFGPLLFSSVSCLFVFLCVYWLFVALWVDPETKRPAAKEQLRSFAQLYWMTAPIAWLYALPVERFMPLEHAAAVNVGLLGLVSTWRVALFARALAVSMNTRFIPMLVRVLLPACVEVVAVSILSGTLATDIMLQMGGLKNAPEVWVVFHAAMTAMSGAVALGVACLVLLAFTSLKPSVKFFAPLDSRQSSWKFPVIATCFWLAVAIHPQRELRLNARFEQMLTVGAHQSAVAFASGHTARDFAPARRLAPSPYKYETWEHLPKLLLALDSSSPLWLRETYLDYSAILLDNSFSETALAPMLKALRQMPEWGQWARQHRHLLNDIRRVVIREDGGLDEKKARQEIREILASVGIHVLNQENPR